MKKKMLALVLSLALCVSLFPAVFAADEDGQMTYDEAVAQLRSGTGHSNEQTFETDECTVFVYDRGGFMNAPSGAIKIIYKAGSALGDGFVLEPPNVRNGMRVTPADTMTLDPEKKTFTYSYLFETTAYDSSIQSYDTRVEPGIFTFTVDLPTGEISREYRAIDYAGAMAHVTRKRIRGSAEASEDREVVRTLETEDCTIVLTKGRFLDKYDDYILSLVYKPGSAMGDGTIKQLILPTTVYSVGYGWYNPTDREPDSLELSADGKTLTYTYSFDESLTVGDTVYHEAGTYTYTVDLPTGELSAVHTDDTAPAQSDPLPQELAERLKALGLFLGDESGNFNLDSAPTRIEALVMLIRALGEETQAKAAGKTHPFADVPAWADGYVSWGYAKGYTNGVSTTEFGSNSTAGAAMYLTFMLRALGYSDKEGDFAWDSPYLTAREAGILPYEVNCLDFTRGDGVLVTAAALFTPRKGEETPLHTVLQSKGALLVPASQVFSGNPFQWQEGVEKAVDAALDEAIGVGQTDWRTARVQSHAILDADREGDLLRLHVLVCPHSLNDEELSRGDFGSYYSSRYLIELSMQGDSPAQVLSCEPDESVYYWDEPQYKLFRDDLELVAQKKMTDLIVSGTVHFRPPTYDEAVEEVTASYSPFLQIFETDYGTIFVCSPPNPHASHGYMKLVCKDASAQGEGVIIDLPHPRHSLWTSSNPADTMELSEDGKTFTYSYHYDEPVLVSPSGRMLRPAGDFFYTVNLPTGEIAAQEPEIPEGYNTYAAALERVLHEESSVVEQTLEAPTCTVLLRYFQADDGRRSYFLTQVYKSRCIGHEEGSVYDITLPFTQTDGAGQGGFPVYYTDRAPDVLTLSEDGTTLTYTYNECHYGSPYTQTIVLEGN